MRAVISIAVLLAVTIFWCFIIDGEVERLFEHKGWKKNVGYHIMEFIAWYFILEMLSFGTYYLLHDWIPYLYGLTEKL